MTWKGSFVLKSEYLECCSDTMEREGLVSSLLPLFTPDPFFSSHSLHTRSRPVSQEALHVCRQLVHTRAPPWSPRDLRVQTSTSQHPLSSMDPGKEAYALKEGLGPYRQGSLKFEIPGALSSGEAHRLPVGTSPPRWDSFPLESSVTRAGPKRSPLCITWGPQQRPHLPKGWSCDFRQVLISLPSKIGITLPSCRVALRIK